MSPKKLIKALAVLCVLSGLALIYWLRDYIVTGALITIGVFLYFLTSKQDKTKDNLDIANFINVFTHFRVALDSDANVFNALKASLDITSGRLHEELDRLVMTINKDHSVTPFITFAKKFNHRFVTHIMINIYMLINHGLDQKRLWQFNYLFETLLKEYNDAEISLHQSSYERFDLSLFIGSGIMMFTIMGSVLMMVGGAS